MKFRNQPLYKGEYFLALTIPPTEPDVIPCTAKLNPDGSYRLVINVLYAAGDLCFARERASHILSEHPTWKAGLFRTPGLGETDSVFMAELAPACTCGQSTEGHHYADCPLWDSNSPLGMSR